MVKKIVITGPESSGKTTLAEQLATTLNTLWVPEFARQYLEKLERRYLESDLLEMAKGQVKLEQEYLEKVYEYLICDTDLITIKIWSEYKYGRCDDFILKAIESHSYDFYFLAYPDLPWESDPQRENPENRMELYQLYKKELDFYGKRYVEIKGGKTERLEFALLQIRNLSAWV